MLSKTHYFILVCSSLFSILPFCLGIFLIKKLKKVLPIFYIVTVASLFEILGFLFLNNNTIASFTSQLYTVIEFSVLCHFYIHFFKKYFNFNFNLFYILIPIYIGASYFEFIYYPTNSIDSLAIIVESIFFIIVSLLSFVFIIKYFINDVIVDSPLFWVNSGILIYFSGNILLFLFYEAINPADFYLLYVYLHSVLNIIYNSLLCVSFYKSKRN